MPGGTLLTGFIAAALVVLLIPGPGVLYVVARSAAQGYRAGLASALGLSLGALVHVVAATAGLSAILLASATAFGIVKLLGAAYLIWLGIRTLLSKVRTVDTGAVVPRVLSRLVADGIVISVFNPKIAIFFLAFLPQFVDPGAGPVPRQILLLGLLYAALGMLTDGGYALLAGGLRQWLGSVLRGRWLRYLSGGIYVGLGISAALTGRRP